MQQDRQDPTSQLIDPEPAAYITLLAAQREIGITRGTLKKYLTYLSIEPICFHIGTRSLYISREAMALVQQLKQNPALLAHLPSPGRSKSETTGVDKRKDSPHGL